LHAGGCICEVKRGHGTTGYPKPMLRRGIDALWAFGHGEPP